VVVHPRLSKSSRRAGGGDWRFIQGGGVVIRPADDADADAIWRILEPVFRAGETYALPRDIAREDALAFWSASGHSVFVALDEGEIAGTYFLRANQRGGGDHVANCAYVTSPHAVGRGVARAMSMHSLEIAKARGFRAMQFNFVVSCNERAVRLWRAFGFEVLARLPGAFRHPDLGFVDALVMHRDL
jgi:GNAT superfamily N-acetyltransferase